MKNNVKKIAIIVPQKSIKCLADALWMQRYGPLQVANVLEQTGHKVMLFNEELYSKVNTYKLAKNFEVVGISAKTSAIKRAEQIAYEVKHYAANLGKKLLVVLGGEHASLSGSKRLSCDFDIVLRGESERQFTDIIQSLSIANQDRIYLQNHIIDRRYSCSDFDNDLNLSMVHGYRNIVNSFVFNKLRWLWIVKNRRLPMLAFQASRGCPYNCSFCPTSTYLQGNDYRRRAPEKAVKVLASMVEKSGINKVVFEDPTAALPFHEPTLRFFRVLANSGLNLKITLLVRVDLYRDIKLLKAMKKAGVKNLSIGIETLNDLTRQKYNKQLESSTITEAIDRFHKEGFSITGLFIVGSDEDNTDVLDDIARFIETNSIEKWRVSPLGQLPEIDGEYLKKYRVFRWNELDQFGEDIADYYNGDFVTFFPKRMPPSVLQKALHNFNDRNNFLADSIKFGFKNKSYERAFQRFGNNLAQQYTQDKKIVKKYISFLENIEGPFYERQDAGYVLLENKLKKRFQGITEKRDII